VPGLGPGESGGGGTQKQGPWPAGPVVVVGHTRGRAGRGRVVAAGRAGRSRCPALLSAAVFIFVEAQLAP